MSIYLFIYRLDRCSTQLKNCEAFVRGKTQRTSTRLISDLLHLNLSYSLTHISGCSLVTGRTKDARANKHKHTHRSARFLQFNFPDSCGNGMK